jgi:hypothetical protein
VTKPASYARKTIGDCTASQQRVDKCVLPPHNKTVNNNSRK